MMAEDEFIQSLGAAKQHSSNSFQFIISQYISKAIKTPDYLERISLILEASQLLKLDKKTTQLEATAEKLEVYINRVYAVCISLRSMKDVSFIGGTLVGWSFPQNEQTYAIFIKPWLDVSIHYKLSSETDNEEKQQKIAGCKTIAEKFWLVTSEIGMDEISAMKIKTNFIERNMPFCLSILDSISQMIPLDVYIQTVYGQTKRQGEEEGEE